MSETKRQLLKMSDLPKRFGCGLTKIYELKRDDPRFPKPVLFGRTQVFASDHIEEYISNLFEARGAD